MPSRPPWLRGPLAQALLVGGLVGGMWVYGLAIFEPTIDRSALAAGQTQGTYSSDIYPAWLAAHELLWHGRDPYSPEVTADIQRGFYGRVLAPDDPVRVTEAFVYPPYTVFLLAPFTLLPFEVVKPAFYFVIIGLLALTTLGWLRGLGWRPAQFAQALLALLGMSTIPALSVFLLQQPSILVASLLAGAVVCLQRRWYGAAGVILALAMIKPQLSGVLILWLLAWAASDWRRRGGLILGWGGTMAALLLGSFLLVPNWLPEWLASLRDYAGYATAPTVLGPLLLAGVGVALIGFLWVTRRAGPGDLAFNLGVALTTLAGILSLPGWAAYNQLILYPAALLVLQQADRLRALGLVGRLAYTLTVDFLLWPWLAAAALVVIAGVAGLVGAAGVLDLVQRYVALPWVTSLVLPVVFLAPLGLLAWQAARAPLARVQVTPLALPEGEGR